MKDTKTKILELAESYTQLKGFNAFSYLDLAAEIGIKAASIHYHFKSKDDLALALVERSLELHTLSFRNMDIEMENPIDRLIAVKDYFKNYVNNDKFCLCGMMAAELQSVSPKVKRKIDLYFTDFQSWLASQFKALGHVDTNYKALQFLSALEGALLIARVKGDPEIVEDALRNYFKS
jgi:TetR/AcrR family transcriptional repressor of nem operon